MMVVDQTRNREMYDRKQ